MTKFKVGDEIRCTVDHPGWNLSRTGFIGSVTSLDTFFGPDCYEVTLDWRNKRVSLYHHEMVLLSPLEQLARCADE